MLKSILLTGAIVLTSFSANSAELIGSVDTAKNLLGPNDKVIVERYDDPDIKNVSCYVSRAVTGGLANSIGISEDRSRFSIACRATGKISYNVSDIKKDKILFRSKTSFFFKSLNMIRMYDKETNVVSYLTISTKLIDGSPYNSLSAVSLNLYK